MSVRHTGILAEKALRDTWDYIWYERNKGYLKEDVLAAWAARKDLEEE